jgi:hypothetical protein
VDSLAAFCSWSIKLPRNQNQNNVLGEINVAFEKLSTVVRISSINRIANVLEIQSDSKNFSFGVDAKW